MSDGMSEVTEVEVDASVSDVDTSSEVETQISDPDGDNFDYDGWAKAQGLKANSEEEIDLDDMKAKHESKGEDDADDTDQEGDDKKARGKKDSTTEDSEDKVDESDAKDDKPSQFKKVLKAYDKEKVITDEKEYDTLAQKGLAADEKFYQASQLMNQTKEIFQTLRDDPSKIFNHPEYGDKFKEAAEKYLYDELKLEQLRSEDPDRYEGEVAKRRLAEFEKQELTRREQEKQTQLEQQTQHYKQQFARSMSDIVKQSGLPETNDNLTAIANEMKAYISKGVAINVDEIARSVRERFDSNINQSLGNLSAEELIKKIGKEGVDKIRKYNIEKVRSSQNQGQSKPKVLKSSSDGAKGNSNRGKKNFASVDDMMDDVWSQYQ